MGGTYFASSAALRTTDTAARSNFAYYSAFTPHWYAKYPGAWFAAGWTAARIWSAPAWGTVAAYGGYPAEPVYDDYGETVVYSGDTVVVNGETEIPADVYDFFAVGADAGLNSEVTLNEASTMTRVGLVSPFTGADGKPFTGGARVATADLNADGVADIVAGTGPATRKTGAGCG